MDKHHFFDFTNAERDHLAKILAEVSYDPHGSQRYITDLRIRALPVIPRRIIDALFEQRASIQPRPYLIFENLPTDEQVFTTPDPAIFSPAAKSHCISENLIIAFASLIGEPYSIYFEGADIVNNLIPTKINQYEYTGLGSEVELDFHIENAALRFIEDFNFSPLGLLLTGVRHDPQGPLTRLVDVRSALKLLENETVECLRKPEFRIKVPHRWRSSNIIQTDPVALLRGNRDLPEVSAVFYPDMVEPQTAAAANAMAILYKAIQEVSFSIDIKPGTLVYIDNRFTLHSRDKFNGSLDDAGNPMRWVQRVFVSPNLWNHRNLAQVKSRVFQKVEQTAC